MIDDNNYRLLYNRAIVDKLQELISKYPNSRFGQLLVNVGIIQYKFPTSHNEDILTIDPFYEESKITWDRIKDSKL